MKRTITLLLIAALVFTFAACSDSGESQTTSGSSDSGNETAAGSAEDANPENSSNTTYDVGDFTVFVPEGWEAIPVPDRSDSEKNAANDIMLAKSPVHYDEWEMRWKSEEDKLFYITYLDKENFEKYPESERAYCEEEYANLGGVTDLADVTIGSLTWHGFSVSPLGSDVYILWAESGEGGYITGFNTADLSLEEADVQAILGSLK